MFQKSPRWIPLLVILVISSFLLLKKSSAGRQSVSEHSASNKIVVTATFYPLADFASQVGGDLVSVKNITPAGSEPHDFEPTPQDLVTLQNSKVFIYNGAGLELWLDKIGEDIKGKSTFVEASKNVSLLPASDEEEKTPHYDPHVWMDPVLASQEVENIKNGLTSADPVHKDAYSENASEYQKKLADLDEEFKQGLAQCARHEIVTSHNAFQYLGKRYGLSILSISGLSPDEEPSPKKLAEVANFVKQNHVSYIFFESLVSPKLSETIAHESGAKTIAFNPLEGLTDTEIAAGKNYISVQRQNLSALRTALECK